MRPKQQQQPMEEGTLSIMQDNKDHLCKGYADQPSYFLLDLDPHPTQSPMSLVFPCIIIILCTTRWTREEEVGGWSSKSNQTNSSSFMMTHHTTTINLVDHQVPLREGERVSRILQFQQNESNFPFGSPESNPIMIIFHQFSPIKTWLAVDTQC